MLRSIISSIREFRHRRKVRQEERDKRRVHRARNKRTPIIQIDRRYCPWWVVVFSWAVLLGWPCYVIWARFVYPAFYGRSYYERYIERQFPELLHGKDEEPFDGEEPLRQNTPSNRIDGGLQ